MKRAPRLPDKQGLDVVVDHVKVLIQNRIPLYNKVIKEANVREQKCGHKYNDIA